MHDLFKILIFIVLVNTFFVIGGVSNVGGSLIQKSFNVDIDGINSKVTGISSELSSSLPEGAASSGFETGTTGLNFIDSLKTFGRFFFGFMLSTLVAPINIFIGVGLNNLLALMLAVPLTIAYLGAWVSLIRGL